MKRIVLSVLLFSSVSIVFAQDIKKIRSSIEAKQFDKAKADIDAYLQKNPDNAEGLYY